LLLFSDADVQCLMHVIFYCVFYVLSEMFFVVYINRHLLLMPLWEKKILCYHFVTYYHI